MPPARALVVGVLLLATGLRVYGLWFGLPHPQARPDETVALGIAAAMLRGDPNPHFFHWPTLHMYVLAGALACLRAVRYIAGAAGDPSFSQYAIVARALVACGGTATVYVIYRMTRRIDGTPAALAAALFLAVAVLHVRESHFALPDIGMTMLVAVSLGFTLRFVDDALAADRAGRRGARSAAAAGLAAGLAASTKYNGGAVVAAMLAAQALVIVRTGRSPWRIGSWAPLCVYLVLFGAGFLAGTPYAVLDPVAFARGFMFSVAHLSQGHGVDVGPAWLRHLTFSVPAGLGWPVYAAAMAGCAVLVRRRSNAALVLGTFVVFLFLAVGRGRTAFARYILPLVPIACVLAGIGAAAIGRMASAWVRSPPGATLAVLSLLVASPSLVDSIWLDVLLSRTDTRVAAASWLSDRLPRGSTLYESGSPYVRLRLAGPRIHRWGFDPASGRFRGTDAVPDWLIVHRSPLWLYTQVPDAVQELARTRYRLVHRFDGTVPGSTAGQYDLQDAFFLPLSGFGGVLRPGPTIEIYQRRAR